MKRSGSESAGSDSKRLEDLKEALEYQKADLLNPDLINVKDAFNQKIWDPLFEALLTKSIRESEPYNWGTVTELMNDELLRNVRKEVLHEIAFTKKETDIYKVYQLGDLANLSGLDWSDLSRLPSLFKLRAAIYSREFRDFISSVTGCGALSGIKTDMSINTYTRGCHLLTHDDVIGSRRVSFILYLPDPDKQWKEKYGGALRLFPAIVPNVPAPDFSQKLVPQFNQIAFFTVQPGHSFHDVEEVRVDRQRLSVQGWFHIPQPGEDGFVAGEEAQLAARSTLSQLQLQELMEYDFPKQIRTSVPNFQLAQLRGFTELAHDEIAYLRKLLNPSYLDPKNLGSLANAFLDDSVVELRDFLNPDLAIMLAAAIREHELSTAVPKLAKDVQDPWKCAMPPHKQRFMYIDGTSAFGLSRADIRERNAIGPSEGPSFTTTATKLLEKHNSLLMEIAAFLRSQAFRKWIVAVTGLCTTSDQVLVRRFRPGHDFILATTLDLGASNSADAKPDMDLLLEATLGLTPTAQNLANWELGEYGGYELCMSTTPGGSDDPAVYRLESNGEDAVLYTSQCQYNQMTLMVRDPSVLKFVKYVSANEKGSRWDISCQWNVQDHEAGEEEEMVDGEALANEVNS